ncbi:MAG: hypothetical protein K6T27_03275 [Thermoleophilum sp.]|nr:hypothetical protein [Thermoleophilum sp.]
MATPNGETRNHRAPGRRGASAPRGGRFDTPRARRARRRRRLLALVAAAAAVALLAGAVAALLDGGEELATVERFAAALERRDSRALARTTIDRRSGRPPTLARVRAVFGEQWRTATLVALAAGKPEPAPGDRFTLPVVARTRAFGTVRGAIAVRVREGRVVLASELAFPGLRPGERLARRELPPARAPILARDGTALASGPATARVYPIGGAALPVTGMLAATSAESVRERLYALGFPRDWPTGSSGLEAAFERRLRGRPGGVLLAGRRVLARSAPRPAPPLRTTIDVRLQRAAVAALGARFGAIAVLGARTGAVRALAGLALAGTQPPGSTFKIVTAAAALAAGVAELGDRFPLARSARVDGVEIRNAYDELCGGTLVEAFAHSCNSVFAPLAVRVGAARLVAMAERLGFNRRPPVPGAVASTLPPARELATPLAVAATAIGQGRVLASALGMASVVQAVAADGVRAEPHITPAALHRRRVLDGSVAASLRTMMRAVVTTGTGRRAELPALGVAGKTGTAELSSRPPSDSTAPSVRDDPARLSAWFCGYAPLRRPVLAFCVLLVRQGAGGDVAAPTAADFLRRALELGWRPTEDSS